jgi:hypothetical protein
MVPKVVPRTTKEKMKVQIGSTRYLGGRREKEGRGGGQG